MYKIIKLNNKIQVLFDDKVCDTLHCPLELSSLDYCGGETLNPNTPDYISFSRGGTLLAQVDLTKTAEIDGVNTINMTRDAKKDLIANCVDTLCI